MPAAAQQRPPDRTPTYAIGELAREFGLTTRAIRIYEDCGLLRPSTPPATASAWR